MDPPAKDAGTRCDNWAVSGYCNQPAYVDYMTSNCAAECEEARLEAAALGSTPEDTPSLSWSAAEQRAMRLALSRAMRAVLIEVRVRARVRVKVRDRFRVRVTLRVNHI